MMIIIVVLLLSAIVLGIACSPQLGLQWQGNRDYTSTNYHGGKFHNRKAVRVTGTDSSMVKTTLDFIRGSADRTPSEPLPTIPLSHESREGVEDLRITWLGHSTCLIEIDGQTILTDPMFSKRASPFSFIGPKRFDAEISYGVDDLPPIDGVLISHDHYDHLDYRTIQAIKDRVPRFYVPLGVGGHLRHWGVDHQKIIELDWWEQTSTGPLSFAATPAQHFSGRGVTDRNRTLWCSWVIMGSTQRVFFGGDSGYFDGFKKIGDAYGPFDLTLLESGAYNKAWADIHMVPEDTVKAHRDLKGDILMPIHWAKFNLSIHPWKEPIERVLKSAQSHQVSVATPKIGETFFHKQNNPKDLWWRIVK